MFRTQKNPRASMAMTVGSTDRVYSRLINAVQSAYVELVARGTFTISVAAATAIRNRGSIWAIFDEIGIDENGRDRHLYKGTVLRFLSEMSAPSELSRQRVSSTAVAAYTLEETVRIYFAHPYAAQPRETAFIERDVKALLQVFARLNPNPTAVLASAGGATLALTGVTIDVMHAYDPAETALPYFIPSVRQQVHNVASASSNDPEFIRTSNALRGICLTQETTTDGEVDDIINKVAFRGDFRDIIGPTGYSWKDLVLGTEYAFGGDIATDVTGVQHRRAHCFLNFQEHGRLSNLLNPNQDNNLRFEFDCQPSVQGVGTSQIRITLLELERVPGLVDPKLPIPV